MINYIWFFMILAGVIAASKAKSTSLPRGAERQ